MSKEFIESRLGKNNLSEAIRQKKQLDYFTKSKVQEDFNQEYLDTWAERKYKTNDYFLNWVKGLFKTENFLSFFKHYRNPNPAASLIDTKVKDQLERVLYSENSYFDYSIRGEKNKSPEELQDYISFNWLEKYLFMYNDIIVHDYNEKGDPVRYIIPVEDVVSIDSNEEGINKIAYTAKLGEDQGYVYIDEERYAFYKVDTFDELVNNAHELKYCPAAFVSPEQIFRKPEVRKSLFSYALVMLEDYTFLKTLLRMTAPNGTIPVVAKLKTTEVNKGKDKAAKGNEPMSARTLSSQKSEEVYSETKIENNSPLQAGTIIDVPVKKKADGTINTDLVQNFLKFHYIPVENLKFINERISEIESEIINCLVGDYKEQNESAKNELQVGKSYVSKEDRLRYISKALTNIRSFSDNCILELKYGTGSVETNIFYGTDFFIETEGELYERFEKSPNPIERTSILKKISRTRNMYNSEKALREQIMYELLPYTSDIDFDKAVSASKVTEVAFQFQTRFHYWIAKFESEYGKINQFWEDTEGEDGEKMVLMTELIYLLIQKHLKDEQKTITASNPPEGVQGEGT